MKTIATLQQEIRATRKEVARITGMDQHQIEMLMVDLALEWLEMIAGPQDKAREYVPKLREFWGFWKKMWHTTDLAFLKEAEKLSLSRQQMERYYKHVHRITRDNPNMNNTTVQCDYGMIARMVRHK
jgi:hypothetical protein